MGGTKMNIENALISKIIYEGEFTTVTDSQITTRYLSGSNKKAFKFINDFMMKYGKVPSTKVFLKSVRNYKLVDVAELDEGMQYYCDEVRKKYKHNTIVSEMEEMTGHIEELETDLAYDIMKQLVMKVENEIILSDRKEVNKDTKSRMEAYHERSKAGGMTGIPSGVDRIDYVLKGFNNKELTALLGFTGTGKTWLLLIFAVYMAKNGYKVLLFTTEMSTDMIIRRIDAIWCKLSYTRFRDGKLNRDEFARLEKYYETIEGSVDENIIIEQATGGVANVGAKIDQHKPEMVMIDGAYLLEDDEGGDDDWKALVRVFRGLHRLCLTKNIPILASTQSNEEKASLGAISFAKHIRADCDVIMALETDDEMRADKEMAIKFLKIREGEIPGRILMEWDFNNMKYGTIYMENNENADRSKEDMPKGFGKKRGSKNEDDDEATIKKSVQPLKLKKAQ